jgi:hypothetical protein
MHTKTRRLLKPRSPRDCPACRLSCTLSSVVGPASTPVHPWREVKSRRGAPKRIPTQGFACPHRKCPSSGITDAHIHASFWRWQAWPCRADPDVSLSGLPHHVQCSVPHPAVAPQNPSLPSRGSADCAGRRARPFRSSAGLRLQSSHYHEAFCPARARTLRLCTSAPFAPSSSHTSNWTNGERDYVAASRCCGCGWRSIPSRAIHPVLHLGPGTQNAAHAVIHTLRRQFVPTCLPVFTSDGLNLSFYALPSPF